MRSLATSVVAVGLAVTLSACASEVPAPSPTATVAAPTPTPTPVAEEPAAPYPAIEISCADFELDDEVSAALGSAAAADEPTRDREDVSPDSFAVTYAGGIECSWASDESNFVRLALLPAPGDLWKEMGIYYSPSSENQRSCSNESNCMADPLTENDVWISMSLRSDSGATDIASWNVIVDRAIEVVSAAPPEEEPWMPRASFAVESDCSSLLTDSEATAAFAAAEPLASFTRGGGWSLEYSASVKRDNYFCIWAPENTEDGVAIVEALEGGEWAWEQSRLRTDAIDREPLSVNGLDERDSAWFSCDYPQSQLCSADLIMGQTWVSVKLLKPADNSRDIAAALLQTIADKA